MPELCLVTDEKLCLGRSLFLVVKQAAEGGVTMVQLREKELNTREFIEKALKIKEILRPFKIPLIINDRVDVALAIKAEGIHVGQKDMPFELLRKKIPDYMITGLSVETIEQAKKAESYNVDYLGVSPIFSTPTKTDISTSWGINGLKILRSLTKHKLIAIGGINKSNAKEVMQAGATGIAVVSAICSAKEPQAASSELLSIISKH
jgi:thiamine-phosphate pyrophosphorylase